MEYTALLLGARIDTVVDTIVGGREGEIHKGVVVLRCDHHEVADLWLEVAGTFDAKHTSVVPIHKELLERRRPKALGIADA